MIIRISPSRLGELSRFRRPQKVNRWIKAKSPYYGTPDVLSQPDPGGVVSEPVPTSHTSVLASARQGWGACANRSAAVTLLGDEVTGRSHRLRFRAEAPGTVELRFDVGGEPGSIVLRIAPERLSSEPGTS